MLTGIVIAILAAAVLAEGWMLAGHDWQIKKLRRLIDSQRNQPPGRRCAARTQRGLGNDHEPGMGQRVPR